jgi:hypothetical protein
MFRDSLSDTQLIEKIDPTVGFRHPLIRAV